MIIKKMKWKYTKIVGSIQGKLPWLASSLWLDRLLLTNLIYKAHKRHNFLHNPLNVFLSKDPSSSSHCFSHSFPTSLQSSCFSDFIVLKNDAKKRLVNIMYYFPIYTCNHIECLLRSSFDDSKRIRLISDVL